MACCGVVQPGGLVSSFIYKTTYAKNGRPFKTECHPKIGHNWPFEYRTRQAFRSPLSYWILVVAFPKVGMWWGSYPSKDVMGLGNIIGSSRMNMFTRTLYNDIREVGVTMKPKVPIQSRVSWRHKKVKNCLCQKSPVKA